MMRLRLALAPGIFSVGDGTILWNARYPLAVLTTRLLTTPRDSSILRGVQ